MPDESSQVRSEHRALPALVTPGPSLRHLDRAHRLRRRARQAYGAPGRGGPNLAGHPPAAPDPLRARLPFRTPGAPSVFASRRPVLSVGPACSGAGVEGGQGCLAAVGPGLEPAHLPRPRRPAGFAAAPTVGAGAGAARRAPTRGTGRTCAEAVICRRASSTCRPPRVAYDRLSAPSTSFSASARRRARSGARGTVRPLILARGACPSSISEL
jgi:hypothetical protein